MLPRLIYLRVYIAISQAAVSKVRTGQMWQLCGFHETYCTNFKGFRSDNQFYFTIVVLSPQSVLVLISVSRLRLVLRERLLSTQRDIRLVTSICSIDSDLVYLCRNVQIKDGPSYYLTNIIVMNKKKKTF